MSRRRDPANEPSPEERRALSRVELRCKCGRIVSRFSRFEEPYAGWEPEPPHETWSAGVIVEETGQIALRCDCGQTALVEIDAVRKTGVPGGSARTFQI